MEDVLNQTDILQEIITHKYLGCMKQNEMGSYAHII